MEVKMIRISKFFLVALFPMFSLSYADIFNDILVTVNQSGKGVSTSGIYYSKSSAADCKTFNNILPKEGNYHSSYTSIDTMKVPMCNSGTCDTCKTYYVCDKNGGSASWAVCKHLSGCFINMCSVSCSTKNWSYSGDLKILDDNFRNNQCGFVDVTIQRSSDSVSVSEYQERAEMLGALSQKN